MKNSLYTIHLNSAGESYSKLEFTIERDNLKQCISDTENLVNDPYIKPFHPFWKEE